jgi:hypothetical protein
MSAFTSEIGTKRTCRAGLRMSVDWGRPEAAGEASTDAIDPNRTSKPLVLTGLSLCDILTNMKVLWASAGIQ